jgi:hypothetical protein
MLLFAVVLALLAVRSLADLDVAYLRWLHRARPELYFGQKLEQDDCHCATVDYTVGRLACRAGTVVYVQGAFGSRSLRWGCVKIYIVSLRCASSSLLCSLSIFAATLYYSQFLLWSNCFFLWLR